jgi:hypothetical protein
MNAHKRVLEMNTLAAGSNALSGAGGVLTGLGAARECPQSGRCAAD